MMAALGSLSVGEAIAVGAVAGAVGSAISQGAAMAMGLQSSFNWGGVAMGAIGGAVSGGIGASGIFSGISGALGGGVVGDFAQGAAIGAAGSIVTQGIDVATGLQKKFDWAGVAEAAIGGGVASAVSGQLPGAAHFEASTGSVPHITYVPATGLNTAISGMAGAIASAGARTLINGSDFGDNLIATLPSAIGNTIGNAIAGAFSGPTPGGDGGSGFGSAYDARMSDAGDQPFTPPPGLYSDQVQPVPIDATPIQGGPQLELPTLPDMSVDGEQTIQGNTCEPDSSSQTIEEVTVWGRHDPVPVPTPNPARGPFNYNFPFTSGRNHVEAIGRSAPEIRVDSNLRRIQRYGSMERSRIISRDFPELGQNGSLVGRGVVNSGQPIMIIAGPHDKFIVVLSSIGPNGSGEDNLDSRTDQVFTTPSGSKVGMAEEAGALGPSTSPILTVNIDPQYGGGSLPGGEFLGDVPVSVGPYDGHFIQSTVLLDFTVNDGEETPGAPPTFFEVYKVNG